MDAKRIAANGLEFAYLERGTGPLVLLFHGYPDNAHTWEPQMRALADAGFRAIAPFTRGYPPTEIPRGGFYDSGTLATDARALIEAFGEGPALVVGHDWGAALTYYLCAAFPDSVRRAVTIAIPHPLAIAAWSLNPRYAQGMFHWWYFQLPGLPEQAVAANDYAWIDYLWRSWSPGLEDPEHVAQVKKSMAEPGALEASLAYYRAMFDPARQDPETAPVRAALSTPISVPTLTIVGGREAPRDLAARHAPHFAGEMRLEVVEGCGHFVHRERPDDVSKLIVEWLGGV